MYVQALPTQKACSCQACQGLTCAGATAVASVACVDLIILCTCFGTNRLRFTFLYRRSVVVLIALFFYTQKAFFALSHVCSVDPVVLT